MTVVRARWYTLRDLLPLALGVSLLQGTQACSAGHIAPAAQTSAATTPGPPAVGPATVTGPRPDACSLDAHARAYLALVDALASRDPRSVDSPVQRPTHPLTAGLLLSGARDLRHHLEAVHTTPAAHAASADGERSAALISQLVAIEARAEQLAGARLTWADETARLVGDLPAMPPSAAEPLKALDHLVPGPGSLAVRFAAFDQRFVVAPDRLPAVVNRALTLCREATLAHVSLPVDEQLEVEFVPGATWSGFSRYQGHGRSTMLINTEWPLSVDRVLDLACHEGYPGHHTINTLRDRALTQQKGWLESSAMLTFSPTSYALEGLASAAPRLVFSEDERIRIVRDELIPLAGLSRAGADVHVRANRLLADLDGVTAEATRAYLTGEASRTDTEARLRREAAMDHPGATLAFIDEYRAYATAYTAGRALAWQLIGPDAPADFQWQHFIEMALEGRLPSRIVPAPADNRVSRATTN